MLTSLEDEMQSQYSIKAASQITGITPDTLRAWERRYGAITPERTETGRRYYSDAEIKRLQLLKMCSDRGHAISMLSALANEDLGDLIAKSSEPSVSEQAHGSLVSRLIENVIEDDLAAFEQGLGLAATSLSTRELINNVFFPLLQMIGERWYAGELSVAQEHAVSSNLRNLVGAMIRMFPHRVGGPSIVFTTLSGERHEFGILLLSLLAASEGFSTHYIGPDLPVDEIVRTARSTKSDVVALSIVNPVNSNGAAKRIRDLRQQLGTSTKLWVGGAGAEGIRGDLSGEGIGFMRSSLDFEHALATLGK